MSNLDPHQRAAIDAHHRAEAEADAKTAEAYRYVAARVDGWAPIFRMVLRRFEQGEDYIPADPATSQMLRLAAGNFDEHDIRRECNALLQELKETECDRETAKHTIIDALTDPLFPSGLATQGHVDALKEWIANIWEQ